MARQRIDALLVDRGLFPSREKARAAVLAGEVKVGDKPVTKPGEQVAADVVVHVAERRRFVSRGGDKLAGALEVFEVAVAGRRAIDVGASTGGFTDCLLQAGAAHVVAVDVGYGQLAWSLRTDERVTVHERTNIRHADLAALGAPFDVVVVDVSFISLSLIVPVLARLAGDVGDIVALVKPQFELGKGRVGKKGVVRTTSDHAEALDSAKAAAHEAGLFVRSMTFSPIKGPEGNIEFWLWLSSHGDETGLSAEEVVTAAHESLGGLT